MRIIITLLATCCLLLSSCTSTPISYYRLPNAGLKLPSDYRGQKTALSLTLPAFLKNNGLAYQTNDVTIDFSRHNLWAQLPQEGVEESLINYLNTKQNNTQFILDRNHQNIQTVKIILNSFYGRYNGYIDASGYLLWQNANGKIIQSKNFSIQVPQKGNGYAAMVRALDQALSEIADTIIASH